MQEVATGRAGRVCESAAAWQAPGSFGVHSRGQAVALAVRDELIESHRRAGPDVTASPIVLE